MRKVLLTGAALAALLTTTQASAESVTTRCFHWRGGYQCTTTEHKPAEPLELTADDLKRLAARENKWKAFCKPREVTGADGLTRFVYAHPDCDLGRSQ
jgi:hypothetical protein